MMARIICFGIAGFALGLMGCHSPAKPPLKRFEFTQPQMGLPFRIVLYARAESIARTAADAAFARVAELNAVFSDYDSDSELSRLSQTSGKHQAVRVSRELWDVLRESQRLAEDSEGAFDITVGPLVNLWRKARREKQLPRGDLFQDARSRVGYRKITLHRKEQTVELIAPNMRLDLGAIAKGYAIDEALGVLRARGISRALVSGGGDMAAGSPPPGRKGWRIEVAPLDVSNAPPARFVLLAHHGLATSGDVFQRLELDGKRYSHIVDPRTGLGLTDHSLVTVIARDCTTADSLATAISVLGPEKGMALLARRRGTEVHIVRMPGSEVEITESPSFRRFEGR